jgi:rubrerythrin
MSSATVNVPANNQLAFIFQYTIEAYKTFEKFAEKLPNPMAASVFKAFALEERHVRDLLEIKYLTSGANRMTATLGADLRFEDILEGDLAPREQLEWLISRERTMDGQLRQIAKEGTDAERSLYTYIAGAKRSHVALLERELQLVSIYPDWFQREDAEDLIVHGKR